jgi:hypothetical protein
MVALALLAAAALVAPPRPSLDNISLAKLRAAIVLSESIDEGATGGSSRGYAICKCAPAAAFAVLTDHSRFAEFMPRIEAVQVSARTDQGERAAQTVDATLSTIRYALDYRWDPAALRVEFALAEDAPHDIKSASGSWQLWPLDGGKATLIEYRTRADVGRSVPGFVRSWLQTRGVKDALEAMRKRIESGGTWRK